MLIKATANQASITQALIDAKSTNDTIYVSGGTVLLNGVFAAELAAGHLVCDGDVTIRPPLHVLPPADTVYQRIKAMNAQGWSGDFRALSASQKAAIAAALPADYSDVKAIGAAYLKTFKPVTDARMWDAQQSREIIRLADITYNGKSYQFPLGWGYGLAKAILATKDGTCGQTIEGFRWQNARMEGSSYNACGIKGQGYGLLVIRNMFEDCENGWQHSDQLQSNPTGEWYFQQMSRGRGLMFGFAVDVDCGYDGCGANGNAHGGYTGQALWAASIRAHVKRANNGIGRKFHTDGPSIAYMLTVDDDGSNLGGLLQGVDYDCGPSYLINSAITKASMAGGTNYQAPVLARNDRDPLPAWMENRYVVMGNVITYLLNHQNIAFIRALNGKAFFGDGKGGDMWPGVPTPLTGIVRKNVFRCANTAGHQQVDLPPGFVVDGNVLIDLNAAIPDLRVPLPNYAFTRDSFINDLVDLITKVDPGRDWEAKLFGMPIYPVGASSSFPVSTPAPAPTPAPSPPPPAPGPTPEEIDMGLYQDRALAAEAEVLRLTTQVSTLTADNTTLSGKVQTLTDANKTAGDAIAAKDDELAKTAGALQSLKSAGAAVVGGLAAFSELAAVSLP
jgi:hypothetical protein